MKKNKLFMALMAGTIVISGCAAKTEKKEENKTQAVDKCRNCMSQQPILMRKSAKNVII